MKTILGAIRTFLNNLIRDVVDDDMMVRMIMTTIGDKENYFRTDGSKIVSWLRYIY
jgi:hypothetical protein